MLVLTVGPPSPVLEVPPLVPESNRVTDCVADFGSNGFISTNLDLISPSEVRDVVINFSVAVKRVHTSFLMDSSVIKITALKSPNLSQISVVVKVVTIFSLNGIVSQSRKGLAALFGDSPRSFSSHMATSVFNGGKKTVGRG